MILSQDGQRLDVSERFSRLTDDRLDSHVTFKARNIKTLSIHAVYRRATPEEWVMGTDGPPPPVPH